MLWCKIVAMQKENDIILHAKPHKSYGLVSKAFNTIII